MILETFRFNGRLLAAGDHLTSELGLSSALWQVLGAIDQEPRTVAQIARNMGLTRQSVRRSAILLHDRGFIEFLINPDHQRAKLAALTPQGREALDQASEIQVDWANRIARNLDASKINAAIQIIKTLNERL